MKSRINRRDFLGRAAGLAAAGAAAGPAVLTGRVPGDSRIEGRLGVGVIGGRFGLSFYWHEHPKSAVTAVCDINQERLENMKRHFSCGNVYTDYRDLVRDPAVDAVAVFTPAPLHVEMAVYALEHGRHVISAVPAGVSEQECVLLLETVRSTGRLYMMAETSYYRREIISCRQMAARGEFGEIIYSESEYHHDGLEPLWWEPDGTPTWRHGFPPMHYPTHCTGMVVPVTDERLTEVVANGWGRDDKAIEGNPYDNPFYSETAFFKTSGGHSSRIAVYWKVASGGTERGQFLGTEMSFYMPRPGGVPAMTARRTNRRTVKNKYTESEIETTEFEVSDHYDLLPEQLRHPSGHGGSHTHITHEFVTACTEGRKPAVDVHEALAYTVPGFYAHQSALEGGTLRKIPDYGRG